MRKCPNLRLTIIGDGPTKLKLEQLSAELQITGYAVFTGRVSNEKLAELVSSSWINIHSSVTEGWGYSITEVASAGTPTVAYRVAGVSDSIENGVNGITVDDGDRKAFRNAAFAILNDPRKWWLSSVEVAKNIHGIRLQKNGKSSFMKLPMRIPNKWEPFG